MQERLEKKIINQNPTYLENPFCPFSVEPIQINKTLTKIYCILELDIPWRNKI